MKVAEPETKDAEAPCASFFSSEVIVAIGAENQLDACIAVPGAKADNDVPVVAGLSTPIPNPASPMPWALAPLSAWSISGSGLSAEARIEGVPDAWSQHAVGSFGNLDTGDFVQASRPVMPAHPDWPAAFFAALAVSPEVIVPNAPATRALSPVPAAPPPALPAWIEPPNARPLSVSPET